MKDHPVESEPQTPRDLLPAFYKQYNLGNDGGDDRPYVKVEFTPKIFVYFPNFDARRKAVFKHDIHHIATGYPSTFKGETEISAWELASGCRHYRVAVVLDLHAMMIGMLYNPAGVYRAFIKGRHTRNLYRDDFTDARLMDMPLAAIKEHLLLSNYTAGQKGSLADWLLFLGWLLIGTVYSILSLVLLPFVLGYTVYIISRRPVMSP
jgi:hypothetical protein